MKMQKEMEEDRRLRKEMKEEQEWARMARPGRKGKTDDGESFLDDPFEEERALMKEIEELRKKPKFYVKANDLQNIVSTLDLSKKSGFNVKGPAKESIPGAEMVISGFSSGMISTVPPTFSTMKVPLRVPTRIVSAMSN